MSRKPGFQLLDLDVSDENLLAYELNAGEVTDDELAPYWKRFDAAADDGRQLRIYAEMNELPEFGDGLVVEKLTRLDSTRATVERMAIVGDAPWLARYAKEVGPIMGVRIRHFPMADKKAARRWIQR
jgi:hypothetical protein